MMANDERRVACVLGVCVVAGAAGVLVGQPVPGAPDEQQREADEAEAEADAIEVFAEDSEWNGSTEAVQEAWEEAAIEAEEAAREAEAEVPGA